MASKAPSKTRRLKNECPRPCPMDKAMQNCAESMWNISQSAKTIMEVQKQFNDNFILHNQESQMRMKLLCDEMSKQAGSIGDMRKEFREWFYPLMGDLLRKVVYGSIAILGGALGLKIAGLW